MKKDFQGKLLGVLIAAASALICAVIDYLTTEETP